MEGREGDGDDSLGILSRLPEPILQHMLCFLSEKDAVKTSVLSKAWRYIWCARPKIYLCECCSVPRGTESFFSVADRVLHGCHGLQDVSLLFASSGKPAAEFANRWIPTLVQEQTGLQRLDLAFYSTHSGLFELPTVLFQSESIRDLSLRGCELQSPEPASALRLKHLRILKLNSVSISDELLDHILTNCTFLEDLDLSACKGFTSINLLNDNQPPANLKRIHLGNYSLTLGEITVAIGSNTGTLTTVDISGCNLSVNHGQVGFARLTSLVLTRVRLLSSDLFSCTSFPCLKELRLDRCKGIEDLNLPCCPKMKRLDITVINRPFMATVDAPSLVSFRYEGILPQSISFGAPSDHSWKSNISLRSFEDISNESPTCFDELIGLLDALSQSEVSLALDENLIHCLKNQVVGASEANKLPVVVEHLRVEETKNILHSSPADFLNSVFHIFRPRFMRMDLFTKPKTEFHQALEILIEEREMAECDLWQRVLEGVSVEAYCTRESEWRPVQYTNFAEFSNDVAIGSLGVHLKWRDLC